MTFGVCDDWCTVRRRSAGSKSATIARVSSETPVWRPVVNVSVMTTSAAANAESVSPALSSDS